MKKEKLLTIDPPSGWKYGFPKAVTQEQYESITNLKQWCIDQGYPKEEADSYGKYFHIQINGDLSFMDENKSTRVQALAWWKQLCLSCELKDTHYVLDNLMRRHIGFERRYHSLTGREIEEIWRKENPIAALPDEMINIDFESEDDVEKFLMKSNQKQFKQFDESLFKAYINKFSDEDKLKAFEILNEEFCYYSHAQMELVQKNHDKQIKLLQNKIFDLSIPNRIP